MSRPTRARGLKRRTTADWWSSTSSRPTRARGLKRRYRLGRLCALLVAPHTGAWIETLEIWHEGRCGVVAPHTGAWIETLEIWHEGRCGVVAPHTGAWIETTTECEEIAPRYVAPHTGAWIETGRDLDDCDGESSRPTRARGLKPVSTGAYWPSLGRAPHGRVD